MKHVTTTFRLPEELYEKLRYEAFNQKVSLGEIVRRACRGYFEYISAKQDSPLKYKE